MFLQRMDSAREQQLLDEIAKRDAIIERQAAEILVLRQTIDALTRRVFGVSSEKLDPAQLELLLDADAAKSPTPPLPQTQDRRLKPGAKASPHNGHALRASRTIFPSSARRSFRPKSNWNLPPFAASARKCANNSASSPPSFTGSSSCAPNSSASAIQWPSPSLHHCRHRYRTAASRLRA